jgi:hypothetical protein
LASERHSGFGLQTPAMLMLQAACVVCPLGCLPNVEISDTGYADSGLPTRPSSAGIAADCATHQSATRQACTRPVSERTPGGDSVGSQKCTPAANQRTPLCTQGAADTVMLIGDGGPGATTARNETPDAALGSPDPSALCCAAGTNFDVPTADDAEPPSETGFWVDSGAGSELDAGIATPSIPTGTQVVDPASGGNEGAPSEMDVEPEQSSESPQSNPTSSDTTPPAEASPDTGPTETAAPTSNDSSSPPTATNPAASDPVTPTESASASNTEAPPPSQTTPPPTATATATASAPEPTATTTTSPPSTTPSSTVNPGELGSPCRKNHDCLVGICRLKVCVNLSLDL